MIPAAPCGARGLTEEELLMEHCLAQSVRETPFLSAPLAHNLTVTDRHTFVTSTEDFTGAYREFRRRLPLHSHALVSLEPLGRSCTTDSWLWRWTFGRIMLGTDGYLVHMLSQWQDGDAEVIQCLSAEELALYGQLATTAEIGQ